MTDSSAVPTDAAPSSAVSNADGQQNRILTVTTIVSTAIAFLAVVASIISASLAYGSTRDAALRSERAGAYAAYVEVHTRFHEFVWAHLYHAGTDTGTKPDADDPSFWSDAIEITSALESTNVRARMLAQGTEVEDILIALRGGEADTFRTFKCMAALECSSEDTPPATNSEIKTMLASWSEQAAGNMKSLIDEASNQLQ